MKKLLIIDGYSIINRAFYGIPMLNNAAGLPTNAVYGFLAIMFKTLDAEEFSHIAVAFDVKKPTFRHEMYAEYKGTRKPMPEELVVQVPMLKKLLGAMKIKCIELPGFEADDILGTLARRGEAEGFEVRILSGDRDLLQTATKKTAVIIPRTHAGKTETFTYDEDGVMELYGVTPKEFIDMKALMGDSSDNIPGLPGVGEKTAGALIAKYKSIEECYKNVEEIKPAKAKNAFLEHFDLAVLSKKLATINTDAPLDINLDELLCAGFANEESYGIVREYNFKSLLPRFMPGTEVKTKITKTEHIVVCEKNEAGRILNEASAKLEKDEKVSVCAAVYDSVLYGLSVCFDDGCYYICREGDITEEFLLSFVSSTLSKGMIVMDARNILSLLKGNDRFRVDIVIKDVHLMYYLLDPLASSYGYSETAEKYLGLSYPSEKEIFDKKTFLPLSAAGVLEDYASDCAYVAYKSYDILYKKLRGEGCLSVYTDIEMPLMPVLFRCEQRGIRLLKGELKNYGKKLAEGIVELEKKIYDEAGVNFNLNSPKQLGEVLFEKLGLPGGKKTKTGYSTSADVLEKLAPDHSIVKDILNYRQLSKLKSTYADGLDEFIKEDGKIHCRFNQTITATGRISCSDPNLQNIPVRMPLGREIRKLFVPEDGWVFVDADYSQIELRILAHMSGDENLLLAYKDAKDIHAATAAAVFHVDPAEVTPELRRKAKAVNFGIVYGISSFGLSEDINVSRKEANEIIERYFESYKGVKSFLDGLVSKAKQDGFVKTMYGRIRPVPELKAPQYMQRMFGERVAMNSPIQGSAADIMKLAMIRTDEELTKRGLRSRIVLQVHDELLLECPEEEKEEVKALLEETMRDSFDLLVPLEISVSEGKTWYDAK